LTDVPIANSLPELDSLAVLHRDVEKLAKPQPLRPETMVAVLLAATFDIEKLITSNTVADEVASAPSKATVPGAVKVPKVPLIGSTRVAFAAPAKHMLATATANAVFFAKLAMFILCFLLIVKNH